MKKMLIGLLALSVTTLSLASTEEAEAVYKVCAAKSVLAKAIMNLRQLDTDIVKMMSEAGTDLLKMMVIEAYSQPYYYSQEAKDRVIADFGTKYYLMCLEGYR